MADIAVLEAKIAELQAKHAQAMEWETLDSKIACLKGELARAMAKETAKSSEYHKSRYWKKDSWHY